MGVGIRLTCERCGWSEDFYLGRGMLYGCVENTMDFLPHRYRPAVQDIVKNHQMDDFDCQEDLFVCEKCGALKQRFWMRFRYGGDKIFETEYDCHKCRRRMRRIAEDEMEKRGCPACGEQALKCEPNLLWD